MNNRGSEGGSTIDSTISQILSLREEVQSQISSQIDSLRSELKEHMNTQMPSIKDMFHQLLAKEEPSFKAGGSTVATGSN